MGFIRRSLGKYPLLSNCCIYGSLYFTAEFSQQTLLRKVLPKESEPYDKELLQRYGIVGTFVLAPTLHYWYRFLDRRIVGTSAPIVLRKCLVDQFFFTPQLLALFFVSMGLLEGKRENLTEELRAKFLRTFAVSSCFWLPVQGLNFSVVPPTYRVTYIGVASLLWANILCYFKRSQ